MECSWREISAKISPKRRPADKKDQKKKKKTATTCNDFLHDNSASYARISRRDCETSFKKIPAKKRAEKEESLGKLLRNNFDN